MKLIIDTNVLIDALRLKKDATDIIDSFESFKDELYISSIVGFELFSGKSSENSYQQKLIRDFLDYFQVLDVTWNIAQRAGEIYRGGVTRLEFPDYIIAATAMELGGEVVTLNKKHFSQIPGIRLYEF